MGFLDKLKSVKNLVTGGGARISLEMDPVLPRGEKVAVTVRCEVEGAALTVSKVYLAVRAVEMTNLVPHEHPETRERDRVFDRALRFSKEFVIHGAAALPAYSTHVWRGEIELPVDVEPSHSSTQERQEWEVLAAIDVAGNDPDTGWIDITVR